MRIHDNRCGEALCEAARLRSIGVGGDNGERVRTQPADRIRTPGRGPQGHGHAVEQPQRETVCFRRRLDFGDEEGPPDKVLLQHPLDIAVDA